MRQTVQGFQSNPELLSKRFYEFFRGLLSYLSLGRALKLSLPQLLFLQSGNWIMIEERMEEIQIILVGGVYVS